MARSTIFGLLDPRRSRFQDIERSTRSQRKPYLNKPSWLRGSDMKPIGKLRKVGRYWAVEIPSLSIFTQGTSKKDAYEMAKDAIEVTADKKGFEVMICPLDSSGLINSFSVESNDPKVIFGLMIRGLRLSAGLSQVKLAKMLKFKSVNSIARYEQFKSKPKIEKIEEICELTNQDVLFKVGK